MSLPIEELLEADSVCAKYFKDKIFEDVAPLNAKRPYLVFQDLSGSPVDSLDCAPKTDHISYQVMVWDESISNATKYRALVMKVLQEHSYINNSRINLRDLKTDLTGRGFDGNWFFDR